MTSKEKAFDEFWSTLNGNLADQPLKLSTEMDSFYSQPEWTVYRVHYSGIDGYPLFAWISIPSHSTDRQLPALLRMPDYGSVHDVIHTSLRQDAIVMNATHRGQRHSDSDFQAQYPGLLTEGIDRPETFVMLRVFADAIRAVDALLGWIGGDPAPTLVLTGSGLGGALALAAAAHHHQVKAVAADTPLALGHPMMIDGKAYPLGEIADYLRIHPDQQDNLRATTAPLNPVTLATKIDVPVLLSVGRRDQGQCPMSVGSELAAALLDCDLRVYDGGSEGGGHLHEVWQRAINNGDRATTSAVLFGGNYVVGEDGERKLFRKTHYKHFHHSDRTCVMVGKWLQLVGRKHEQLSGA